MLTELLQNQMGAALSERAGNLDLAGDKGERGRIERANCGR